MTKSAHTRASLLPYPIIAAAVAGDAEAVSPSSLDPRLKLTHLRSKSLDRWQGHAQSLPAAFEDVYKRQIFFYRKRGHLNLIRLFLIKIA